MLYSFFVMTIGCFRSLCPALLVLLLWCGISSPDVRAQNRSSSAVDSASYETQRSKVNHLLEERKQRFGEFDQSLLKKTGVFGIFKTKRDMQRSIDILKEIVVNDNYIFLETKKLINLKDFEKAHFQKLASQYDEQASAYMRTITHLQTENDRLRQKVADLEEHDHRYTTPFYLALLVLMGFTAALLTWYRRRGSVKN